MQSSTLNQAEIDRIMADLDKGEEKEDEVTKIECKHIIRRPPKVYLRPTRGMYRSPVVREEYIALNPEEPINDPNLVPVFTMEYLLRRYYETS